MGGCRQKEQGVGERTARLAKSSPYIVAPSALFAGLDNATVALIMAHLIEEVLPADSVVFEENAPGDTLYLIQSGLVQVSRTFDGGQELVVRTMGPGEFFGEMALLEDKPRSARVSTVIETTLLAVTRQCFNALIEQHPAVGINFLKAISAQLRRQYQEQAVLLQEKQEARRRAGRQKCGARMRPG